MWSISRVKKACGPFFLEAVTAPGYLRSHPRAKGRMYDLLRWEGDGYLSAFVRPRLGELNGWDPDHDLDAQREMRREWFESTDSLYWVALQMGLLSHMRLSDSERKKFLTSPSARNTKRLLSEAVEAIIAGIVRHSGYEAAESFVLENIVDPIYSIRRDDVSQKKSESTTRVCMKDIHKAKKKVKKSHPDVYSRINKIERDKKGLGQKRIPMILEILKEIGVQVTPAA